MSSPLPTSMRRARPAAGLFVIVAGLCLLLVPLARAQTAERQYEIKSAFLYHFLQYADWDNSHDVGSAPLSICVLGADPFGAALDKLVEKQVDGRTIEVRRLSLSESDDGRCHVAFFPAETKLSAERLLRLQQRGVLTVGDGSEFTKKGGMIRLYQHRNRIRFEIDLDTVRRGGIRISSHVLRLARIV